MKIYPDNYDVSVSFAFTDLNGAPVAPTAVKVDLFDGNDQLIISFGSLPFGEHDTEKEVVVPAEFNTLDPQTDGPNASRIVRCTLETPAGNIRRSASYVIEGDFRLQVMKNSFITFEAAELTARDIPNSFGWRTAGRENQEAALINAFNRLTRIPMKFRVGPTPLKYLNDRLTSAPKYHWTKDLLLGDEPAETVIPAAAWHDIDADEFMTFPDYFRKAVRLAQVAEANDILENDVTNRRHRQGIISETVGESSIMLRGGQLNLGVSRAALEYLSGHVYYNHRISRA